MTDVATARIRAITIDVSNRARAERFWGGVLGLGVAARIDQYSYFDDAAPGVRLVLQAVADRKLGKNRMHLDLTTDEPDALLARIVGLGGRIVDEVDADEYTLTVASDPDGNEFCVTRRLSRGLSG